MTNSGRRLLTTRQVAEFVRDGMLELPGVIGDDLNQRAMAEMKQRREGQATAPSPHSLTPLSQCYPHPSALGDVLRHPLVAGAILSLLGPQPAFDHDFTHHLPARWEHEQLLHVDAIKDSLDQTFDIQLFYFPHAIGPGEGGTRFVPGTHLRHVNAGHVGRYQHILGERFYVGEAGTVLVAHHGIWHAGKPNPSASDRWMHKFRLNPTAPQVRHWDTSDLSRLHNGPHDHVFATSSDDSVATVLRHRHEWMNESASRIEIVQRAKLWRYLTGDETYDVDYYLTRIERRAGLITP